jgi:hypothetical protein
MHIVLQVVVIFYKKNYVTCKLATKVRCVATVAIAGDRILCRMRHLFTSPGIVREPVERARDGARESTERLVPRPVRVQPGCQIARYIYIHGDYSVIDDRIIFCTYSILFMTHICTFYDTCLYCFV